MIPGPGAPASPGPPWLWSALALRRLSSHWAEPCSLWHGAGPALRNPVSFATAPLTSAGRECGLGADSKAGRVLVPLEWESREPKLPKHQPCSSGSQGNLLAQ